MQVGVVVLLGEGLVEEPDHDGEVAAFIVAEVWLELWYAYSCRIAGTHVGSRTEYLFFWVDILIALSCD